MSRVHCVGVAFVNCCVMTHSCLDGEGHVRCVLERQLRGPCGVVRFTQVFSSSDRQYDDV